jgi:hypothetical protein
VTKPKYCAACGQQLKAIQRQGWERRRFSPDTGELEEWVGEVLWECPRGSADAMLGYESGHSAGLILTRGSWRRVQGGEVA